MDDSKLTVPILLLSLLAAGAFGFKLVQEQTQVHRLTLATASASGEYYAFGQAFATLIHRHHPDIQLTVATTEGSLENVQLLQDKQAQLALIQSDTPITASVRAVAMLFPEMAHLLVRSEANIETLSDLKGKPIALMPEGSGSYKLFWPIANHYGLNENNLPYRALPSTEAYRAFEQGEVQALFQVMALGNERMRQLLNTPQVRLLPIDQVAALRLTLPYLEEMQIPKGTYNGGIPNPSADIAAVGVRAVLVAHRDLEAHLIQTLTTTLYENRTELVTEYPRAASILLPDSGEDLGLPLHEGAKSYYNQGQPNFLVEYAETLGLLLSVSVLGVSGLWQLNVWLQGKQKNRADMYNLQILGLIDRIHDSLDEVELTGLRKELFDILRKVVVDLDKDRISAESFQSFTLTWEVAITTLRHQETIVLGARRAGQSQGCDPI